MKEESVLVFNM